MMIQHYIKIAFRNILKHKGQTVISIIGLSVGILCFSFANYFVRYDYEINSEFLQSKNIANVGWEDGKRDWHPATLKNAELIKIASIAGIENVSAATSANKNLYSIQLTEGKEIAYSLSVMHIDKDFIELTSGQWIAKDESALFKKPNSVILTRTGAERLFKEENPLGKVVRQGEQNESGGHSAYTIVGILEDMPGINSFSQIDPVDMYIFWEEDAFADTECLIHILRTPGVSWEEIGKRLKESQRLQVADNRIPDKVFYPRVYAKEEITKDASFWIMFGLLTSIG